ncbi:hypothetical protein C7974DRAFT_107101 [Boeremia exigua]|uniref:uncharacterized protein n=1 Tax=Boeremia exigua TaxID=749465 RepID=UPI001E8DE807|nr:uncharacterized protein C7974DRAFT_107101 [Boeremia exigua]KAH6642663.1 hypothetical protein C7974DRAFT_107101 [Boeremia exigua]
MCLLSFACYNLFRRTGCFAECRDYKVLELCHAGADERLVQTVSDVIGVCDAVCANDICPCVTDIDKIKIKHLRLCFPSSKLDCSRMTTTLSVLLVFMSRKTFLHIHVELRKVSLLSLCVFVIMMAVVYQPMPVQLGRMYSLLLCTKGMAHYK